MLSLLVISAITGLCLAQLGEYSDCPKLNEITTKTCEHHLTYLKTLHSDSYNYFMEISKLKDPINLVQTVNIEKACNQSDHLSIYYKCVFTEVKSCLVNSSQKMGVPDLDKMADAILSICENQNVINGTCYKSREDAVAACSKQKMMETMENFMPVPGNEVKDANPEAADGQGVAEVGEEGMAEDVKDDPSAQSQANQNSYQTYTRMLEKQKEQMCRSYEVSLDCLDEAMSNCRGYEPIVWELSAASAPEMCGSFSRSAAPATLVAPLLLLLLLPVLCRWLQA